jgi:hypothetical protein
MDLDTLLRAMPKQDLEYLKDASVFVISKEIAKASEEVGQIWLNNARSSPHINLPATARLPAEKVILHVDGKDFLVCCRKREEWVIVAATPHGGVGWKNVGSYIPGGEGRVDDSDYAETSVTTKGSFIVLVAHLFSLINTPTYTISRPLVRQQKRAHARAFGQNSAERIRVVAWDITKPKLAAGESIGSGRHMPLHYTRGHWRKCEAHHNGAITHDDGVVRQWIEGFWSGHPAYGTIKSVYAPTLGEA